MIIESLLIAEIRAIIVITIAPLGLYYIYALINNNYSYIEKGKRVFTKKFFKEFQVLLLFQIIIFIIILYPQIVI